MHEPGLVAVTLATWRRKLFANAATLRAAGYPETLLRMWDFYLAYSEAGFRSGHLDVAQLVLSR